MRQNERRVITAIKFDLFPSSLSAGTCFLCHVTAVAMPQNNPKRKENRETVLVAGTSPVDVY